MCEQRPRVQIFLIVDLSRLVGGGPLRIAFDRQRMCRRAQAQQVDQQPLVVALPSIAQEAAAGLPTKGHRRAAVLRPVPIGAAVKRVGKFADLAILGAVAREILRSGQHARQEKRGVDRRKLAIPGALAVVHVEEMVVEALVPRRVCVPALNAVMKESQGRERSLGGVRPGHEAALYANGIGGEGEADGGDAGGPARLGLVGDQSVERVRLIDEIVERLTL